MPNDSCGRVQRAAMRPAVHCLLFVIVLTLTCGCDTPTLWTGSTLNLSFEAAVLHPTPLPEATPRDKETCIAAGGAIVDVRAWGSDGIPAEHAQVTLWLEPAVSARIVALSKNCAEGGTDVCLELDEGGEGNACLFPGVDFGTVTVFAHSGPIQQSKSIVVGARSLSPGSTLAVTVAPRDLTTVVPTQMSTCGVPSAVGCIPGHARSALVSLISSPPDGAAPPTDGTVISLQVDAGWVVTSDSCNASTEMVASVDVVTLNGAAAATWCFGDVAASGMLRAHSGSVTGSGSATVLAIPSSVLLTSSASSVADGGTVTLTAAVTGCDGVGVAGVPVLFRTVNGSAQLSSGTPVPTGSDGIASITATISPPARFIAALALSQQVSCSVDVGGVP